jgi:hypothetical protein
MELVRVRKVHLFIEEILHEGGPPAAQPRLRGAVAVVMANPYAGRYEPDIMPFMEALKPVGIEASRRLVAALGNERGKIDAYGKATIIGAAGELEHGACWHVPGGYAMREVLGGAKAIVPSATKVGPLGARIDVPLHHKDAAYVRSHFDAIEVGVPDAPRPDEIVFILGMAAGPRVHSRAGGFKASEISVGDGQR